MSAFNRLPSHTSRGLWKIPSYPLWKNESEKGKYYLSIIMKIVFTLEPWWSLARTWRTVGRFGGKTRSHCSQTALGGCTSGRVCAGHGRCEHSGPGAQAAVRAEVPIPPAQAGWVGRPRFPGGWLLAYLHHSLHEPPLERGTRTIPVSQDGVAARTPKSLCGDCCPRGRGRTRPPQIFLSCLWISSLTE